MTDTNTTTKPDRYDEEHQARNIERGEAFRDLIVPMTEDELAKAVDLVTRAGKIGPLLDHLSKFQAGTIALLDTVSAAGTDYATQLAFLDPIGATSVIYAAIHGFGDQLAEQDNKILELEAKVDELQIQLAAA